MSDKTTLLDEGSVLFYNLIHDLKTPLSTLKMAVSNVQYMIADHIREEERKKEYDDILRDADNSIEEIARTIRTIQELLTQNNEPQQLVQLAWVIKELKILAGENGFTVTSEVEDFRSAFLRWRGYSLVSVLSGLVHCVSRFHSEPANLQIRLHRGSGAGRLSGETVGFNISAEINPPYNSINDYFNKNRDYLLARWMLERNAVPLHIRQIEGRAEIYFEIPLNNEEAEPSV